MEATQISPRRDYGCGLKTLKMGHKKSLGRKAARFVSDLTTGLLNPISDQPPCRRGEERKMKAEEDKVASDNASAIQDGPDTSSFTAFLYSLLSSDSQGHRSDDDDGSSRGKSDGRSLKSTSKQSSNWRTFFPFRGRKRIVGKAVQEELEHSSGDCINQASLDGDVRDSERGNQELRECEMKAFQVLHDPVSETTVPDVSEHSLLLSEATRSTLCLSLPALVRGSKWVLLYSTWRHGISLSTLYRRSMLCHGHCLLVVGDREGAVFGGLVEAPLSPTSKRKYQGTCNSFVFTDVSGSPVVFRPTGANRYFTLCSTEFIAFGGGGHFALYLDGDLSSGSSSASETFGNSCLSHTTEFDVKEVELWGFTYVSKYGEGAPIHPVEASSVCRW